ncbi:MAG TPA: filamentous hemagglutinin N-terminal domain-containing protein [Leptolyngbyaceae cyanobacterium]
MKHWCYFVKKRNALIFQQKFKKSAIAIILVGNGSIAIPSHPAFAQIVPDTTLGNENSTVTPIDSTFDRIDGGATRGINLFHSFQEFNIDEGRGVYFTNPAGIQNIFSRVTGTNLSQILGTLGVTGGNASLFLINPNGIIFGQNARLDVAGSFVGTTAHAVQFGQQGFFSAAAPNVPQILTVNPSAFLFNQITGPIVNQSTADETGMQVPAGASLMLVGGDITLDGGILQAPGGRIELGGLADKGSIQINWEANNLNLTFPTDVKRANVSLENNARVDVSADGGGNIAINVDNLNVTGKSQIRAGIASQLGTVDAQAGNIDINATGTLSLTDASLISNAVQSEAIGKGGNVNITVGALSVTEQAELQTLTQGQGDAGNIMIKANDNVNFNQSFVFSGITEEAIGNAGNIEIDTSSLSISNGAQLQSLTRGEGNAGNIAIRVEDAVTLDGMVEDTAPSGITSLVELGAFGKGGDITIQGRSIFVTNGAQLGTSTFGQGDAGKINIQATEKVVFDGGLSNTFATAIFSNVTEGAVGNAGGINITAGSLFVNNSAFVDSSTFGEGNGGDLSIQTNDDISVVAGSIQATVGERAIGNAGNINIQGRSLFVSDGGLLITRTNGEGNAGNINVNVTDIAIITGVPKNEDPSIIQTLASGIYSNTEFGAIGDGGNIHIQAGTLNVTDGAQINASTISTGKAGNINIVVGNALTIAGENDFPSRSQITSRVGGFSSNNTVLFAEGDGGDITIKAGSLALLDGATIDTITFGLGDAGNIAFDVRDDFTLAESAINSRVAFGAEGKGGNISVQAESLSVKEGAEITGSSFGNGNAGNIDISVRDRISLTGVDDEYASQITTEVGGASTGKAGYIQLKARSLEITDGALLSSRTFAEGDAGNISIEATDSVTISGTAQPTSPDSLIKGISSGIFTSSEGPIEFSGIGGEITLTTGTLQVTKGAVLSATTLSGSPGGNIVVNANRLELSDGGQLLTTTFSDGNAGNITVKANENIIISGSDPTFTDRLAQLQNVQNEASSEGFESINLIGQSPASGLFANTGKDSTGTGGNLTIFANQLTIANEAAAAVTSQGTGGAGTLKITAPILQLSNSNLTADTQEKGQGNIELNAQNILLRRNSLISTNAGNTTGGNIAIDTQLLTALENSDITANAVAGFGGRVNITAQGVIGSQFRAQQTPNSDITATSELGSQFSGIVEINTPEVDPSAGLIELPENVLDINRLVAQSCPANPNEQGSEFFITGRAGLPPNPNEALSDEATWIDLRPTNKASNNQTQTPISDRQFSPHTTKIVEATGWAIAPDGKLILIANSLNPTPHSPTFTPPSCQNK